MGLQFLSDVSLISEFIFNLGSITIVLKVDSTMILKRQPKTEDMDICEYILNNSIIWYCV